MASYRQGLATLTSCQSPPSHINQVLSSMKPSIKQQATNLSQRFEGADVSWIDDMTVQCKGTKVRLSKSFYVADSTEECISLCKDPSFVLDYMRHLPPGKANNIVEVGIYHGGSAVFFWNLLQPKKLCCIEINNSAEMLSKYIEREGLSDQLKVFFGTDQSDKQRLDEIMLEQFGSEPLDLVIDDASHTYPPSLATFEALFPRLRRGGLFFLEDWKVHAQPTLKTYGREDRPEDPPLHQLVHDLLNISIVAPGIISSVRCFHNFVIFTRGGKELDSSSFSVKDILEAHKDLLEL